MCDIIPRVITYLSEGLDMFSNRLKALREDSDLTQSELAKILNISRETVSGYENTDREPNFDTTIQIANYFNVSLDYLLCRTDVPAPYPKHK